MKNLHKQDFLKPREVAAILRVSMDTLARMRREGTAPAHIRQGRTVRYPVASFEAWLSERMSAPNNEANNLENTSPTDINSGSRLIKLSEVLEITGLSRTKLYLLLDEDKFPRRVKVGERAVAWVLSEVIEWAYKQKAKEAEAQ